MVRTTLAASLTLVLLAGSAVAANPAEINAIRAHIRDLHQLKKDRFQQIDAHFNQLLRKKDRPEDRLERELARLGREESAALRNISDNATKNKIRADFNKLRADMRTKVRAMEANMGRINQNRAAEKARVGHDIDQRIRALEARLHHLQTASSKAPKRPKGR